LGAADAIGQVGDPRLDHNELNYWVRVDGGTFWMGAQSKDPKSRNYDPEAFSGEAPLHPEEIRAFQMGRYPVTVTNHLQFMEAGGYGQEKFWTAGSFGEYTAPGSWQRQLRYPNRPVMEINWFEAAACCAWMGGRLPTEAEWECAARGGREGVHYPWGDQEPDEYRASFGKLGSGHPTPVGLCPEGAAPGGIQDLAGNCWEWASDGWRANYEKETKQGDSRVIRGGALNLRAGNLRVSIRDREQPDERYSLLGFRVVRDLPA
jgi:iron(II)-dependent oxidoreductase